ncbi:MAG TPA: response regulator, partial [Pyrinomonadaceae bacterium]
MSTKFNVLVVDDEPDKRQLLAFALEMEGYNVQTAENGAEGLAATEAAQPDLIITDVMMPQM